VNPPPCVFAPRPLANYLWSDPDVPIWPYTSGTLLEFDGPGVPTAFSAVDLDVWGKALTEAVDWVTSLGYGDELRGVRETLAECFAGLLMPAYADEPPDPEALATAREAYRQTLLTALANAYADSGADAPLRRAPAPLVLVSQAAAADGLLYWRYTVEYAQVDRAAEDQVLFKLSEIRPTRTLTESNALFQALAEFAWVYPELRADLEGADREVAAASFINVMARVAESWSDVPPATPSAPGGMATLTELDQDGKLVMRIDGAGEVLTPQIAGYTTAGSADDFQFVGPDGEYLAAVEGRALPRRQLWSAARQIVDSRTGEFAATVVRNARFAPAFVYQSGPVTFAEPVHASIDVEQAVELTEFVTPPNTLAGYLTGFFERVFGADPVAVETSLSGAYDSGVDVLPIFAALAVEGVPDALAIQDVVVNWIREVDPVREGAALRFDLAVSSTANGAPAPLLRLRNIVVRVGDVAGL